MDEALAGHADWIDVSMSADGFVTVVDNGRGMPVDPHPKFPKKSALEVIMCTLHAGGNSTPRSTRPRAACTASASRSPTRSPSAGSRGRARRQALRDGVRARHPQGKLKELGRTPNRRGTCVRFRPDAKIFGAKAAFKPARIFKMARSKAYLFGGVEIRWSCDKALLAGVDDVPEQETFHFERGLDRLSRRRAASARRWSIPTSSPARSARPAATARSNGRSRGWRTRTASSRPTATPIPTQDGGTHEAGLRAALTRGIRDHAERAGQGKRAANITQDDVMIGAGCMLSVFIREPEFQGQTKDRLARWKRSASPKPRSRTMSTTGSPAIRRRRTACSTG
jgi:topoisomerase-4 subunit B